MVLNASLLALSGLLILGGKLGDILGRRRVFLFGTVLFTVGSAIGGFAVVALIGVVVVARLVRRPAPIVSETTEAGAAAGEAGTRA